ncbi:twitching motility protein PilT [candidate division KSB1 bacterium]|nr:MAG: twitching motility protein PilT [candidate division KSB1 bacterium]
MDITELLTFTKKAGGSDLHLSAGSPVMIRVHGEMRKLNIPMLTPEEIHHMIYDIIDDEQKKIFEERKELDFSRELGGIARFRVNVFQQKKGEAAVFRTIPTRVLTFEELNLPEILKDLAMKEKGLVLVTGPTGSGKSTTLAAIIDYINKNKRGHIITIEDPIEFVHESHMCLVNQRELGTNTHSFANALRSALREDPDVVLVGEMRDLETISLAITAAETGHLVFGTLHTSSAAKTVDRVIDVFPPEQQAQIRAMFAESIEGVIAQKLLRRKDKKGRCAALEVMLGTPAIRNLIREGKTFQIPSMIQTGQAIGMQSMDQALKKLVTEGLVDKEEALKHAFDKKSFEASMGI